MTKRSLFIPIVFVLAFAGSSLAADADHRTKKGSFIFVLQAEPSAPVVGSNRIMLTIRDAGSGAAVEGATVRVVPWMSMHGHGSPKETRVQEKGNGVYEVDDVYYSMEGSWDLLVSIQKGNLEDAAGVAVEVKR
jgi:hypothetical protein